MKNDKTTKKDEIVLYALSTCIWCKKTKKLLNELKIEYRCIDVDLLDETERKKTDAIVAKWNPARSYPTLVIGDETCVLGYDPEKIKDKLGF